MSTSDSVLATRDDLLCCPSCGETWTHVDHVVVGARPDGEDGPVRFVHVDDTGAVDAEPFGAGASDRRHAITLVLDCEACGARSLLAFAQHKGQTEVTVTTVTEPTD